MRRASGPVASWLVMLDDLTGNGRDGFIDWMQIDRRDSKDIDLGLLRHWLDPTVPFSQQVLNTAHGIAITSATLKDETAQPDDAGDNRGWAAAKLVSGAAHIDQPALLSDTILLLTMRVRPVFLLLMMWPEIELRVLLQQWLR